MNGRALSPRWIVSLVLALLLGAASRSQAVPIQDEWLKLEAPTPTADARFGSLLALEGRTLIIAAFNSSTGTQPHAGKIYAYEFAAGDWEFRQELAAPVAREDDRLGFRVALDGDVLAAGAPAENQAEPDNPGAVYVSRRSAGVWGGLQQLPFAGGVDEDLFGEGLDVEGNRIVVGAPQHDADGPNSGAAYVYEYAMGSWHQGPTLAPAVGHQEAGAGFGSAVAIRGDTIFVGAPGRVQAGLSKKGAVFVFQNGPAGWAQVQKLEGEAEGDAFGNWLAVDGTTLAVGAPHREESSVTNAGAVYLYEFNGSAWQLARKAVASDPTDNATFGYYLDLEGDVLVVGAFGSDVVGFNAGAAYIFRKETGLWPATEDVKLIASDSAAHDLDGNGSALGTGVSISGDVVALTAEGYDIDRDLLNAGAAYLHPINDADGDDVPNSFDNCPEDANPPLPDGTQVDGDDDGAGVPCDCDDANAAVNPGATEDPGNGLDDDCSPATEDCPDADDDGYSPVARVCGLVDCNDGNAAVNPGAAEIPRNGIDDDCNPATPFPGCPEPQVAEAGTRVRSGAQTASDLAFYLIPIFAAVWFARRARR